jgi:hypothetical protein
MGRWLLRACALGIVVIVYGAWKALERQIGLGGFLAGAIRGAVLTVFIGWVWLATSGSEKNLPKPASLDSRETNLAGSCVDATYEKIDQELATQNLDRATWTRALGDAEGNPEVTKALYIKYRAQRMLSGIPQVPLSSPPSKTSNGGVALVRQRAQHYAWLPLVLLLFAYKAIQSDTRSAFGYAGGTLLISVLVVAGWRLAANAWKTQPWSWWGWLNRASLFAIGILCTRVVLEIVMPFLSAQSSLNRAQTLDFSNQGTLVPQPPSTEEMDLAREYGITPQEVRERSARGGEICRNPQTPTFVDFDCWTAVMAGRR